MPRLLALTLAALLIAAASPPQGARVRLDTSIGPIVVEVDVRRAPITANNFLAYVDQHKFDGTSFYRAARNKYDPGKGFVQGGVNHVASRSLFPIEHEPTTRTGLRHTDGALSMARFLPGSAQGDFSIVVGAAPFLDAHPPGDPGYAAFGHVVSGMPLVRKMLAAKTWPGARSPEMVGQMLHDPVTIITARRVP